MRLHLSTNPVGFVHESEMFFDSMVGQVLDCLRRKNHSVLEIWVIYESLKQQVLEMADNRWGNWQTFSGQIHAYENELLALEFELLTSDILEEETRSILLMLLAMVYYRIGELEKAKQAALVARREYSLLGLHEQLGFADLLLALCSLELGELQEASDRCVLAMHAISFDQDPVGATQIWQIHAQILFKLQRTEEAVATQLLASEMLAKQGATARQAKAVLDLSLLLASQEDWHGAIYYLKKMLPACRQQGLQRLELEVLHMLFHLFQKTGQQIEAAGCKLRINQILEQSRQEIINHWLCQ